MEGIICCTHKSLRIDQKGYLAHTPHPFPDNAHIVRDFCENQTEINTPVLPSAQAAVAALWNYTREVQQTLRKQQEYLWPFSNPPYIQNENDVPIALFSGKQASKPSTGIISPTPMAGTR